MAERLTPQTPDLEVRGSSFARCVVSLELYSTLSILTLVYKRVPATYCWGVPCDGLASRPGGSSNTPMHATGIITFCLGLWLVCTRLYLAFTCESPVGIDRDASTSYCSGLNKAMLSILLSGTISITPWYSLWSVYCGTHSWLVGFDLKYCWHCWSKNLHLPIVFHCGCVIRWLFQFIVYYCNYYFFNSVCLVIVIFEVTCKNSSW